MNKFVKINEFSAKITSENRFIIQKTIKFMNLTIVILLIVVLIVAAFLVYEFALKKETPSTPQTVSTKTPQKSGPPAFPEGQGGSGSSILPTK